MIVSTDRRLTLEDYLSYDDGTNTRHELVDGVLVEMGAESTLNTWIAMFLVGVYIRLGVPTYRLGQGQLIEVSSSFVTARLPDLIVHSEASATAIEGRSEACLRLDDPVPLLVVEVVSSSDTDRVSKTRDYVLKRDEYEKCGIPEYWIVDPIAQVVIVLTLEDGVYRAVEFRGNALIVSPLFLDLTVTAAQVLTAKS
jgi:Uma2 family endonuclease